jgi:hypothetical protein
MPAGGKRRRRETTGGASGSDAQEYSFERRERRAEFVVAVEAMIGYY